jgi:hypothetical protein
MGNQNQHDAQQLACPYRVDCGCTGEKDSGNFVVKVQSSGLALGKAVQQVESVPPLLFVMSPNGQQMCAGIFMLVSGMSPNGFPLWRKVTTDSEQCRWLYSSTNGNWNIGGHQAERKQFHCHAAHIFSDARHNGAMPHETSGNWWRLSPNGFLKDPAITVSTLKTADTSNLDQYLNSWPFGERSSCASGSSRPPSLRGGSIADFGREASTVPSLVGGSSRGGADLRTPPSLLGGERLGSERSRGASERGRPAPLFQEAPPGKRAFSPVKDEFKTPPEYIQDPASDRDVQIRLRLVAQKLKDLEGNEEDTDASPQYLQEKRLGTRSSSGEPRARAVEVSFFPSVLHQDTKVTFSFAVRPLGIEFENVRDMMVVKGFCSGSGAPALGVREGMVVSSVGGMDVSRLTFQEGLEQLWREVK